METCSGILYDFCANFLSIMDFKFTLKKYFYMVFFFVICPIVGWIAYAHRYNAPANVYLNEQTGEVNSNNVTIPDNQLDLATPYYQNDAALKLEKETGRPTMTNAEEKYFDGQPKESAEKGKKEGSADATQKENK